MKISIKVHNLNTGKDISNIRSIITSQEGILACEISKQKKEIQIVYDALTVSSDEILNIIEMAGYMIYS